MVWNRPGSRFAVSLRRTRHRLGIAAPRVSVRTHVPWYVPLLRMVLMLVAAAALVAWAFDLGRQIEGRPDEVIAELRARLATEQAELAQARKLVAASESALNMERGMQASLAARVAELERLNASQAEELAVFEGLGGAVGVTGAVRISRPVLEPDAEGGFRYRMLLVKQGGKSERGFSGAYQLVLHLEQAGRGVTITLPERREEAVRYALSFRHFVRVEGRFSLPPQARLKAVDIRVIQEGRVVASGALPV